MATVPVTRTWVAGEVVTAPHFNDNIRDVLLYLLARPIFQGRQTSAQSIPDNTVTAVTFNAEDVDSAGGHSTSTNTSRYTAVYPGWYRASPAASFAANATGARALEVSRNGTLINGSGVIVPAMTGGISHRMAGRTIMSFLNVGDYLETSVFQNSGGALNTAVGGVEQSTFCVSWESN